jgi:hypothetical protein
MTNPTIDGALIKKICRDAIDQLGFTKKRKLHLNLSNIFDEKFSAIGTVKNKLSNQSNIPLDQLNTVEQKKYKDNQDLISAIVDGRCKEKYDFIFTDMPLGGSHNNGPTYIKILRSLNKKGICSFLMPSYWHSFKTHRGSAFHAVLKDCGYKVLSVVNLPSDFLRPMTGMQATLVFISEDDGIEETYFVNCFDKHLVDFQSKLISLGMDELFDKNLRREISLHETEEIKVLKKRDENLFDGIEEKLNSFDGFEYWENRKEFKKIESEYSDYNFLKLKELSKINITRDVFEDTDNAFYIPAVGRTEVLEVMPKITSKKKPHNYFQIVINNHRVKKKYLTNYFNSDHGQKSIELEFSKYAGAIIARLRKSDVENIMIPIPNLGIQDQIIENITKLKKVKELLSSIENSLSFKPISSSEQLSKLNQIYESSMDLSEAEIIYNEIKKGESLTREFKQTFALDIKSKKREQHIIFQCVKTIAGFLNSKGGSLYIGVADNSDITGIEVEIGKKKLFKSLDDYLLSIKDVLKKRLGIASLENIDFVPVKLKGEQVLVINCNESDHQIFIDGKDTYLRVGPSTEKIEGPELVKFSKKFN